MMPQKTPREYIQALRNKDYLGFLQWGPDLAASIASEKRKFAAEDLINLVAYYWLQVGFEEGDLSHIAILQGIMEDDECPIEGQLAYTAVFLISAALQCNVCSESKSIKVNQKYLEFDWPKILDLMNQYFESPLAANNSSQIEKRRRELTTYLALKKYQSEVKDAVHQLKAVLEPQNLISSYIDRLEATTKESPDQSMSIRLGVTLAFKNDLSKLGSDKILINEFIKSYMDVLKRLDMQPWEWEHIQAGIPRPLGERFLAWSKDIAATFFQDSASPRQPRVNNGKASKEDANDSPTFSS